MVDYDPANQNTVAATRLVTKGGKPSVAELKAAISASAFAARYTPAFMMSATKDDLIFACRTHGIAVAGLPGA